MRPIRADTVTSSGYSVVRVSASADLLTVHVLRTSSGRLNRRPFRAMFTALLDHAIRSNELIPAQRRFVTGVTAPIRSVVAEAIEDGRLDSSIKPNDAVAQLVGPLFHQHVMLQARITDELIVNTVSAFVFANDAEPLLSRS